MTGPTRPPGEVFAARLQVVATFLGLGAGVVGLVAGQWWWLLGAGIAVLGTFLPPVLQLVTLAATVLLGAWPAVVAAAVSTLANALPSMTPMLGFHARLDEDALAASLDLLPQAERALLTDAAQALGVRRPLNTLTILRAAIADDPSRWSIGGDDLAFADGYEGGELGTTGWTVVACEAVLVAGCRGDQDREMDIHDVAGAALSVPNSAAGVAAGTKGSTAAERALGLSSGQVGEQFVRATRRAGSELIRRRVEEIARWRHLGPPPQGRMGELSPERWNRLLSVPLAGRGRS